MSAPAALISARHPGLSASQSLWIPRSKRKVSCGRAEWRRRKQRTGKMAVSLGAAFSRMKARGTLTLPPSRAEMLT